MKTTTTISSGQKAWATRRRRAAERAAIEAERNAYDAKFPYRWCGFTSDGQFRCEHTTAENVKILQQAIDDGCFAGEAHIKVEYTYDDYNIWFASTVENDLVYAKLLVG
jgi:hypothetical protein